jgi:hypothetical protein
MQNNFDTIQTNISTVFSEIDLMQIDLSNILSEINIAQDYLNCTINTQDSVCYRLGLLEAYASEINATTISNYNNILSVNSSVTTAIGDINTVNNNVQTVNGNVLSMNTTLVNLINSKFANLTFDTSGIMDELSSMQSFNEELVFLVTDSVGMQKAAQDSFNKGDLTTTIDDLQKAQKNLETAARIIEKQKTNTQVTADTQGMSVLGKLSYFITKWLANIF